MKAFSFDLSKFKKSAEDKQYTTLTDANGHKVMILHSKLPPMMQEQLRRLKMANGGRIQKLADGTPDDPLQIEKIDQDDPDQPGMASGHNQPITINVGQSTPAPAIAAPVAASMTAQGPQNAATQFGQTPVIVPPVGSPPLQTQNYMNPNGTTNAAAAVQGGQQAIGQQAAINASQGHALAQIDASRQQAAVKQAQDQQQIYNELKGHTDDFAHALNGDYKINPNHWAETQTVPEKIANAIGLLAGGFKQGFSGGGNPAMDWMNKQIDRDIDSQKARSDQQRTIYGAYHDLYGAGNTTNALTRASMDDLYSHMTKQVTDQLATPQAAQAQQALGAAFALDKDKQLREATANASIQAANGGTKNNAEPSQDYFQNHILNPDASKALYSKQVDPRWAPSYPEIVKQYTAADQAEKGAARIDGFFDRVADAADKGGGGLRSWQIAKGAGQALGAGLGAIAGAATGHPAVGGTAGAGAGQLVSNISTSNSRDYDSSQGDLTKYIATALRGTNIGGDQIEDFVTKHSPVYGDTPERRAQLKEDIKNFILDAPETSLLTASGLSGRKHK